MAHLVVDGPKQVIRVDARRLRYGSGTCDSYPLRHLEHVTLRPDTVIHASALGALHAANIDVAVYNARDPDRCIFLPGIGPANRTRRAALWQLTQQPDRCARIARSLIRLRARNTCRWLHAAGSIRHDRRRVLRAAEGLAVTVMRELDAAHDLAQLRALEGRLARAEFVVMRALCPSAFGFRRRERRPPPNPINAMVSLGATHLVRLAQAELTIAGLDPSAWLFHRPLSGRPSLACDLIEPLRPRLHGAIWRLAAERVIQPSDFCMNQGACRFRSGGAGQFFRAMADHFARDRRWLRRLTRRAAARLARMDS